jgi:hypothetical protein
MPEREATSCTCAGCAESAVRFTHFPDIVGFCAEHGGLIVTFKALLDSGTVHGLTCARYRWERGRRLVGDID